MIKSKLDLTAALSEWEETFKWYLIKNAKGFFIVAGTPGLRKNDLTPFVNTIQQWYNTYISWIPVFPPKISYKAVGGSYSNPPKEFEQAYGWLRGTLPGIFSRIEYDPAKASQALKELDAIALKYIKPWAKYSQK